MVFFFFFGNLGRTLGPWKYERAVVLVLSVRADRQLIFPYFITVYIYIILCIIFVFVPVLFHSRGYKNDGFPGTLSLQLQFAAFDDG